MDEPYVSVLLEEYVDLVTIRDFFLFLEEFGIEEWEDWDAAVDEFLNHEELEDLPY